VQHVWEVAAVWMALALVASLVSIRLGVSVALVEIAVGVFGGNVLNLQATEWINALAAIGAVVLTFLAGAEIDPESLRRHLKPSLAIGVAGFLFPFLSAAAFARFVAGWSPESAWIAGLALAATSVAVVYTVMVETGLNQTELGKLILAACFVNDLSTVVALGLLFAGFDRWLLVFVLVTGLVLWPLPRFARWVVATWGGRMSEPEVKFLLLVLFALGWLAARAGSEAVLPAYLIGLVLAGVFQQSRTLMLRLRTIAFGALTPFYFLKAGLFVSVPAIVSGATLIGAFLLVKMVAKIVGTWPLTRVFAMDQRSGTYMTLLISTGLTFGIISALFGLTNGLIDQGQYTVLVTAVIGSAVVPTLIAQAWFLPDTVPAGAAEPPAMESSSPREGEG
jgi:Kef-type K+ transport system membrane component KefB